MITFANHIGFFCLTKIDSQYIIGYTKVSQCGKAHCSIHKCRLKHCHAKKKSSMNSLILVKAQLKQTKTKWNIGLWSKESKFLIIFGKHGQHILQTKEQRDHPACYEHLVQKPASLMVQVALEPMELAACNGNSPSVQ